MTDAAFDAFCTLLEHPDHDIRLVRASTFWYHLGEPEFVETGIDSLSYAESRGKHPAANLLTHAVELGYDGNEIESAIGIAAKSLR